MAVLMTANGEVTMEMLIAARKRTAATAICLWFDGEKYDAMLQYDWKLDIEAFGDTPEAALSAVIGEWQERNEEWL
jgi:hypothetical protein